MMVKLRPLEYLFSITNSGTDKLIMILGIPIRIGRAKHFQKICRQLEVNNNKIVFCNFNGNSYGCNPKYITEEIIRQNLPYEIVWLVKNVSEEKEKNVFPSRIRLVGYSTKLVLNELATAKIWIDNQRKNPFIKRGLIKKENQYYIQTWHGSFGIKKLDADVKAFNGELKQEWVNRSKMDSSMIDYLLTNSEFENNILPHALWFENEIKQFGHPRNDIFFKDNSETNKKVREFYKIPANKKILLYVPSFRDDDSIDCYKLQYEKVLSAMEEKFGGEWICISRLHPRTKKFDKELITKSDKVIDGTFYSDIQELLAISDCTITDYSSCIFDFLLTKRPGFIFATDIEKFNTDRGFYYPLEKTPFPIASNNDELFANISEFDLSKYQDKVEEFLAGKGSIEDGHASERVVELIKQIMNEVQND